MVILILVYGNLKTIILFMTFNKNKNHIYDKSYSTYIIIRYNDKVDRKQGKLHVTPYIAIYYAQVILGFVGASSIAFF
jgi:hypothetical protein